VSASKFIKAPHEQIGGFFYLESMLFQNSRNNGQIVKIKLHLPVVIYHLLVIRKQASLLFPYVKMRKTIDFGKNRK